MEMGFNELLSVADELVSSDALKRRHRTPQSVVGVLDKIQQFIAGDITVLAFDNLHCYA
jgi:hypothetical protein